MPTAPGITPTQPAAVGGTPEVNVPAPVEAFGGAIGHAISGLGATMEQSSDRIWERAMQLQDLQNRTETDNADSDFMDKATKMHADFINLRGENAGADALKQFGDDLKATREQVRAGLSNPMAQKMYDTQSRSSMWRVLFSAASHSGQQVQSARLDSLSQRQTSLVSMAGDSDKPEMQQWAKSELDKIIVEKHSIQGTPDSIPDEQKVVNSSLKTNQLKLQARSNPIGAFDDLEAAHSKNEITQEDYDRASAFIAPRRMAQLVDQTANDVWNSGVQGGEQSKPLKELQDTVREKMKAIAPDDALAQQHAVNALEHIYNQDKSAATAEKNQNIQTINSAILTGQVHTDRDLMNNPATSSAYDHLPDSVKRGIPGQLNNYNRQAGQYESQQNFERLAGMAVSGDPGAVAKFMDTDLMSEKMDINSKLRLNSMRDKILKSEAVDSRVGRAMGWLRHDAGGQLQALNIYRRDPNNPDDYDKFQGALHSALEDWQTTHGKPASETDIVDKIGPLLMKGRGDSGWFSSESHEYSAPPQTFIDTLQAAATKRGEPALSDREMQRAYVQAILKEKYPSAKQTQDAAAK